MNLYSVFDKWKLYRNDVTKYIIDSCAEGQSVAIFGAGRCADIDLRELMNHFREIVLVDRDIETVREGLSYYLRSDRLSKDSCYVINENCKVIILEKDFVGISSDDFGITSKYCADNIVKFIKQGKLDEFAKCLYKFITDIYQRNREYKLDFSEINVDSVVVFGTHSQLNNNFSAQWMYYRQMIQRALGLAEKTGMLSVSEALCLNKLEEITLEVEKLQRTNTDFIIERFNKALVRTAKCRIVTGLEVGNTGVLNSEIDGAMNAILDFERLVQVGELAEEKVQVLTWPFDLERKLSYDVKLSNFTKIER